MTFSHPLTLPLTVMLMTISIMLVSKDEPTTNNYIKPYNDLNALFTLISLNYNPPIPVLLNFYKNNSFLNDTFHSCELMRIQFLDLVIIMKQKLVVCFFPI